MHRVGSAGFSSASVWQRKERRLTYVLKDVDDTNHSAGINCLAFSKSTVNGGCDYLFTGSRDGTLKRWDLAEDSATCSATFESHVDWVNDVVIVGGKSLVSCSSDTTLKTWNCFSDEYCTRTLTQHSDYITCLAAVGRHSNLFASGGLGGEVYLWDIESVLAPVTKSCDEREDLKLGNGYIPTAAKGHKESVYALAMNESGTYLVSGGTEKVVRVWDPRTGTKSMKLKGHTDNIRALLLDHTGRFCLSGSSDSVIRLWDLGQQRCVHSYVVHTDSVWALASTPSFSHVYSGGRDLSLYLTDLSTRESVLLCSEEHPIQKLSLEDDGIWVATTDSSFHRWPADARSPQKLFRQGVSFLAGNLSYSRARVSLEGSTVAPVYERPSLTVRGSAPIVQHEICNNRRHVLTKDASGTVKLWEVSRGIVVENYGKVPYEEKKGELFEMVSVPAWFTVDTRLGNLSVHLESPQCFAAEMYSSDLNISGKAEEDKVNLARETLKGLLANWVAKRRQRSGFHGEVSSDNDVVVHPPFDFSLSSSSIVSERSQGGSWRKKITEFDGTEDEKDFPLWCIDCVLNNRMPQRENTKCSFFLHPCEGSASHILTQGKLNAPRILKIHKVVSYVLEKMVSETLKDGLNPHNAQLPNPSPDGAFRGALNPLQIPKLSVEILCNNQVLSGDISLATVRAYVWKKAEDLVLNYRLS